MPRALDDGSDLSMRDSKQLAAAIEPSSVPTAALSRLPLALVLSNPGLDDNPIVFANEAFEALTGYLRKDVVGRNCRFLQGEATEPDRVAELRRAIDAGEDVTVEITNYRADGTAFRNRLSVAPIRDETGGIALFLGTQRNLDEEEDGETDLLAQLAEIQHRVKNHLAMIVSLIRLQAGAEGAAADYDMLARRVEALQLLYQELSAGGVASAASAEVPLGAYVSRIAAAIGHLDGRQGVRINVSAEEVSVSADVAGRVGLLLSEALTNAFRHAFEGRDIGMVETRLQRLSNDIVRLQVVDDGVGMPKGQQWPDAEGLGGRIVLALLRGLRARYSVDSSANGTAVTMDIPLSEDAG
jgi:PAS domain S-box-containing protein